MGKKRPSSHNSNVKESQAAPILQVNVGSPLFSLAAHPTRPLIVTGLATGHVFCHKYDACELENSMLAKKNSFLQKSREPFVVSKLKKAWWKTIGESDTTESFQVEWKTKRHGGSCRSVIFDNQQGLEGTSLYSAGLDHIIKKASTETGKVLDKIDISPFYENPKDAITTLTKASTNSFLLAGTDDGHAFVLDSHDLRGNKLRFKIPALHEDGVNKLLQMPALSPYHYLSLGSTTMAHLDIRKGVVSQSESQDDELLAMCYPNDYVDRNKNDTVLVGHGSGIVTLWRNSYNGFSDQISRIKVNKNASIDAMIPTMNGSYGDMNDCIWCGDSDGLLHRVNYKKAKVMETRVHSNEQSQFGIVDEVTGLEIDYDYRLISSGMEGFRIWSETNPDDTHDVSERETDSEESDESGHTDDSEDYVSKYSGASDSSGDESGFDDRDGNQNTEATGSSTELNIAKKRRVVTPLLGDLRQRNASEASVASHIKKTSSESTENTRIREKSNRSLTHNGIMKLEDL